MDWYVFAICFTVWLLGYCWGRKDAPANERLSRIKALMREQNERVVARDPSHQPLDFQSLWVDVWVEVVTYKD